VSRLKHGRYGTWPTQHVALNRNHPRCRRLLFDWVAMPGGNQTIQNNQSPDMTQAFYMQTIGNSNILWIPCPYGWAAGVNIQGVFGDRLSTGNGTTFDLAAPLTVQCAIMSPNASDGTATQAANSKESNGSSYGTITMTWNHTTGFASHAWQIDQGSGAFTRVQYPVAFAANKWYDLAATIDAAGTMVIYQDGVQQASGSVGIPAHGTNQVLIGYEGNQGATGLINIWTGYTAFLRYWGRALANFEIRDAHINPYTHYARAA
jgi:concanavalin A-like lectin/glucanase superfamily protein